MLGDAPGEQVAERYGCLVIEHRRSGLGVYQVQAKAEPATERIERRWSQVTGGQGQPQQVVELGDVTEVLGTVLVVGLGDGPHDVAEPGRIRRGEQRQLEFADPLASSGVTGAPPVPRPTTSPLAPILASRSAKCTWAWGDDPIPVPFVSSSSPGPR
jgi:hypothetical protein